MKILNSLKKKAAFTLIEVLIAISILAVSLTALVTILSAISTKVADVRAQSKAVSLVADLEVILKTKSFDEVYSWVRNDRQAYVIYFWDEYLNWEQADDPSIVTISSEDKGKRRGAPPTADDLKRKKGDVYRAILRLNTNALVGRHVNIDSREESYSGGSLPESPDKYGEAYLPISVDFLIDPTDDIVFGVGDEEKNDQRRVYTGLTIKMR
ncbi:MAG: type II secretion system protein [Opitutales bacterium]|nr:type II secretion system protein [Opitutales bacterium]